MNDNQASGSELLESAEALAPEEIPAELSPAAELTEALSAEQTAQETTPEEAPAEQTAQEESEAEPEETEEAEAPAAPEETEEAEAPAEPETEAGEDLPETAQKPLAGITFEEVAEAITAKKEEVKEPTLTRAAIDDDLLLAEIYALIGETAKHREARKAGAAAAAPSEPAKDAPDAEPVPVRESVPVQPEPQAPLHLDAGETIPDEVEVLSEDEAGAPGWLKGIFLLLISLLLGGMTFYAVATDVIGKIF